MASNDLNCPRTGAEFLNAALTRYPCTPESDATQLPGDYFLKSEGSLGSVHWRPGVNPQPDYG